MRPGSQNARLLDVLRQGPATNAEIHARAGHMIVNSRVAELRDRGFEISCEHVDGEVGAAAYRYTLVSEPPLERASIEVDGQEVAEEEARALAAAKPVEPTEARSNGAQLTLEVAA